MTDPNIEAETPAVEIRMDKHLFRELATQIVTEVTDEQREEFLDALDPASAWSGWPWKRYYFLGENGASLVLATSYLRGLPGDTLFEVAVCKGFDDEGRGPGPAGYVIGTDYLA